MYNPYREEKEVVDYLVDDPQYPDPVFVGPVKDPVMDPVMVKDPVYIKEENFTEDKGAAIFSGMLIDAETTEKIVGATVALYQGNFLLTNTQTDTTGYFALQDYTHTADKILFTHVGYKPLAVKRDLALNTRVFYMEHDVKVIDPVVLPPGGGGGGGGSDPSDKNKKLMWGALAVVAILALSQEKKKLGKVDTGTVFAIGTGLAMLLAFKTITKILEDLGLSQSEEGKNYDEHLANPYSFWNPLFWTKGPTGTHLVKSDTCKWLYDEIYNSFSFWGDDEQRIYSAFKETIKYQSQLSYFSDWVQKNKGKDLLRWLHGGNWGPVGDHLSVSEIQVITDYVSKLPKYK